MKEQLTVNKIGVIKLGSQRVAELDLPVHEAFKVSDTIDLQTAFPLHTIWLVGDRIHVLRVEGNQIQRHAEQLSILEDYCRMNAKNLLQLADYLDTVPSERFSMDQWMRDEHGETLELSVHECGTVGCAVGNGPAAGLAVEPRDEGWIGYAQRVFGLNWGDPGFTWCFDPRWHWVDNTPAGAAKRIRHMIHHGVPDNFICQAHGWQPYLFAQETA